ncbi:hypothetical protein ACWDTI_02085 [Gordonia sp. NPDC003424]
MNGEGCWSTVVCTQSERVALGVADRAEWLLKCRLTVGHGGNHATDASTRPRRDRRLWLEWNDFDDRAQSLIERKPCTVRSEVGAHCLFFEGHGGLHMYAPSNGHAPSLHRRPQAGPSRATPTSPEQASRPVLRRGPAGPPGHADRTGMTTDGEIPVIGTASPVDPVGGDDRHARPVVVNGAPVADGHSGYRGGRRSTDLEPPVGGIPRASRHRLPDGDDSVGAAPASREAAMSRPGTLAGGALTADRTGEDGHEIADALTDVAGALQRLAQVLRDSRHR